MLLSLYCHPLTALASNSPAVDGVINQYFGDKVSVGSVSDPAGGINDVFVDLDRPVEKIGQGSRFEYWGRLTELGQLKIPYDPKHMGLQLGISHSEPLSFSVDPSYGYLSGIEYTIYISVNGEYYPFPKSSAAYNTFYPYQSSHNMARFYLHVTGTYTSALDARQDDLFLHIHSGFTLYVYKTGSGVSPDAYVSVMIARAITSDIVSAISGGTSPPSYTDTSISDSAGDLEAADQALDAGVSSLDKFSSSAADYDFSWLPSSLGIFIAGINIVKPLFSALISPPVVSAVLSVTFIFVLFLAFLRRL